VPVPVARRRWVPLLAPLLLVSVACDEATEFLVPPNGSLVIQFVNRGLRLQGSQPPGFQVTQWTIHSAVAEFGGDAGPLDLLRASPCVFTDNVLLSENLSRGCGQAYSLTPTSGPVTVTLQLRLGSIELRRAVQPDLPAGEDHDGDGHLNRYDNCPLIQNPEQTDANNDGVGDPCTLEIAGLPYLDSDADGVPDLSDNCSRVPNPPAVPDPNNPFLAGADVIGGADLIGDACESFVRASDPDGEDELNLTLSADAVIVNGARTTLEVDFDSTTTLACDDALARCKLLPGSVVLTVR
jgi:hypothetical protein